jgi:uncharacterized protein
MEAPRDDLTRSVAFELSRAAAEGDGLTLEGYAAVFDQQTVIDSWEGKFVEQIARGAFKRTLAARTPVIQFDHGRHPLLGSIPLGAPEMLREDKVGLFVRARLHDNWLVEPVRDAIKSGAVDGMSFRFTVVKDSWQDPKTAKDLPVRTIQEVKLYELGPVVFPAYEGTTVGVRSREIADALTEPDALFDLARALLSASPVTHVEGTPDPTRDSKGESADEGPAEQDPDSREHSDFTLTRQRILARLPKIGATP